MVDEMVVDEMIVDRLVGMRPGSPGTGVDLDVATAGNTEVVRAKMKTMNALKLNNEIEGILISPGRQHRIIRPITSRPGPFFYPGTVW